MEENESTSASALRHPDLRDLMRRFIEVRRALNCALKSLEHSRAHDEAALLRQSLESLQSLYNDFDLAISYFQPRSLASDDPTVDSGQGRSE